MANGTRIISDSNFSKVRNDIMAIRRTLNAVGFGTTSV
jgi:hypothetical protein